MLLESRATSRPGPDRGWHGAAPGRRRPPRVAFVLMVLGFVRLSVFSHNSSSPFLDICHDAWLTSEYQHRFGEQHWPTARIVVLLRPSYVPAFPLPPRVSNFCGSAAPPPPIPQHTRSRPLNHTHLPALLLVKLTKRTCNSKNTFRALRRMYAPPAHVCPSRPLPSAAPAAAALFSPPQELMSDEDAGGRPRFGYGLRGASALIHNALWSPQHPSMLLDD